jgi:hypothetical protein
MANISLTGGFTACPEGKHIFRIYKVDYNPEFGKLAVFMVNAKGITHVERFSLMNNDSTMNDKACNAFSFFAKTALNNFELTEIDHNDLVNHYIGGEITHTVLPSKNDPTKNVTFANITEKWVADYFDTEPVKKALTLGTNSETPAAPSGEVDLNSLLN